jgi:Protein of unknown function (DUF3048) N-terminal domain/Protein of unknown function (DUF3048) C-terminal domain
MTRLPRTPRAVLGTGLALALLASACTGSKSGSQPSSTAAAPSTPTSSGSSSAAAPKKPAPKVNPLTGIGPVPKTPTIAVKIDDTAPGRPQLNIDRADIVYIEEVEGGLTRLAAVFGTNKPTVGYVRSTRPSDPDLLLQYGKITEAYSGGAHDSLPRVHRSGITSWSNDAGARFYQRVSRAASSYINLTLNLKQVAAHVKTPRPRDIGLRWSAVAPGKGSKGTDVHTTVGGTAVEFRWANKLKRYVRYIDGVPQRAADGKYISTPNVVVQVCRVVAHPQDTDVLGNPSQFTFTVGKGKVSVFRNGQRFDGTWARPHLDSGTTLRLPNGKPLTLSPGGAWFALVRKTAHTTG